MISVIIPVYNVKEYLDRCMYSILNQTYQLLEIILVDDGSNDGSSEICDSYLNDSRVNVFHMSNQGVSNARNYGLERAKGEYIAFIDADDYVEINYFEEMFNVIEKTESDMVICGAVLEYENGTIIKKQSEFKEGIVEKSRYIDGLLLEKAPGGTVIWNKLYRKNVILRKFHNISMGEDLLFLLENVISFAKICSVEQCLYHYIQRTGSARVSGFSYKHFDSIKCADLVLHYVMNNATEKIQKAYVLQYNYYIGTLSRILYWNVEKKYQIEVKKISTDMDIIFKIVKKSKDLSLVKKYSFWLYKYFKPIYKIFITHYYNKTLYKAMIKDE